LYALLYLQPVNCSTHTHLSSAIITAELLSRYEGLSKPELIQLLIAKEVLLSGKDEQLFSLQAIIEQLRQAQEKLLAQVQEGIRKGWQLEEFTNLFFGRKSERFTEYSDDAKHGRQLSLGDVFDTGDVEAVVAASRARTTAEQSGEQQAVIPKSNRHSKRHVIRTGKRRQYNVEVVRIEKDYEGDKDGLKYIGSKVTEVYDYQPGKFVKTQTLYKKYIDKTGKIYKAAVPPRVIEKGRVSNRLVANVHVDKFVYSMPYERQIKKMQRLGMSFAASTVNGWEEICYRKLKRLLKLFKRVINQQDYLQIDEVPINFVNDVGKGKCSNGYFWVVNAPRQKLVLFEFNPSRGSAVPKELLKDFKGKLQCDGLSSYKTAFKENEDVQLLACLAHIRRGFFKAKKHNLELAKYFLNETRIIYDIEAYCSHRQLTDNEIVEVRLRHIKPILDTVNNWLTGNRNSVSPDSPTGKAFTYACNHWHLLYEYLHDGKLLPDNNGAERAIRPVTLYRKNSLFAGNEHGARRAALFFSLLETCKLSNIDPFEYLCDVYDRIYDCTAQELHQLLPHNWKKSINKP
jgi:transposase